MSCKPFSETTYEVVDENVKSHAVPLIEATEENFKDYGHFVDDFDKEEVNLVTWPKPGWREVQSGTGRNAGIIQGDFLITRSDGLVSVNNVDAGDMGKFIAGKMFPKREDENKQRVLIRYLNYHPDGGQVFFPKSRQPFIAVLALPGDDVKPSDVKAFYFRGNRGMQVRAGVWHTSPIPVGDSLDFSNKQSAVYTCIPVDFWEEFQCFLEVPIDIE